MSEDLNYISKLLGRIYSSPIRNLDNLERWVAYRTYDRYDVVKIPTLEKSYQDKPEIMLHANFALLVDFVEVELGTYSTRFKRNYKKEIEFEEKVRNKGFKRLANLICWWYDVSFLPRPLHKLFYGVKHSAEKGLKHIEERIVELENAPEATDKEYAEFFKEIKFLYNWWKKEFLVRPEEMEVSGLSSYYDMIRNKYGKVHRFDPTDNGCFEMNFAGNEEEQKEYDRLNRATWDLEKQRREEVQEMLIRLIKIREHLWS